MRLPLLLVALISFSTAVSAQQTDPPAEGADVVYEVAEVQPELVGGLEALHERIVYPADARRDSVEGRVIVRFVVDEEGRVTDPVVLRSPDDRLSEAALAALRESEFRPGQQDGELVKVAFSLPVTFRLPGGGGDSRGPVFWDTEYSDDLERLLDRSATMRNTGRARVMAQVAYGAEPFEGLAPGSATLRFTVADDGRATGIEVVEAASQAVERFARFYLLGTQFDPEAAGRSGTVTYTVTRVGR